MLFKEWYEPHARTGQRWKGDSQSGRMREHRSNLHSSVFTYQVLVTTLFTGYTSRMPDSTLHITVKPKSPRNEAARAAEGVVVRVTAPPVEGAANAAVVEVLAKALGVPKSRLAIIAGASGRVKRVAVRGLAQEELDARIDRLPAG